MLLICQVEANIMNPRTIRRAIERKAQKQARKAEQQHSCMQAPVHSEQQPPQSLPAPVLPSGQQKLANARNAQLSTGPRTPEGKAVASRNALKSGLTGRTVLLPAEDAALYQQHVASFFNELQPQGERELALVQFIAESKWRLARIPSIELGIYALGRMEFAQEFAHLQSPGEAAALIEAKTFLAYQRQLNNLSLQESRLRRQCEKDTAELARLQALRAEAERPSSLHKTAQPPQSAAAIGFEFEKASALRPSATALNMALQSMPQAA